MSPFLNCYIVYFKLIPLFVFIFIELINLIKNSIITITMSQLLFKIMATSYSRYHHQNQLVEDCLNAMSSCVHELMTKVILQISQIEEVLSDVRDKQMSVIAEQTERELSEDCQQGYEAWVQKIKAGFNSEIKSMKKIEGEIDKLTSIYKVELKQLSIQLTKWEEKNKDYKQKNVKLRQENQILKKEVNDLKDQITSQVHEKIVLPEIQCENIFELRDREKRESVDLIKLKEKKSRQTKEKETKENSSQKSNNSKANQQKKWTILSQKINELKSKMEIYEKEISQKDETIAQLKQKMKAFPSQDEEKKKLKTSNTTLRGQKTILANQLNSTKKLLAEKSEICQMQNSQITKLKGELSNVSSTVQWQNSTIHDLRTSIPKAQKKSGEEKQVLQKWNKQLFQALDHEEKELEKIHKTVDEIENNYEQKLQEMKAKINEFEIILEEKNELIIRMKTKNTSEKSTAYYNDLIKVLSKKVAERDEKIRQLTRS